MAAYLVGHITIKDSTKWKIYTEGVKNSLIPFEGEVVFRGKRSIVLTGEHHYDLCVVIKFSDQSMLQQWYNSETYQSLIPVRNEAADVVIIGYDE